MEKLQEDDQAEHDRLIGRLERLAEVGPDFRKERCRDVGDGLYELKTKTGSRILFFYEEKTRHVIVATGGFAKGSKKVQNQDIKRGKRRKGDYETALRKGDLKKIIVTGKKEPSRVPGG
ncbi:MAG: type II toxin-antitoxin system RelE/ParE family toxin [Pontiellaceae bacterium]|nr:type II toxin-antitoxin system RelE/ParE family toxin [Pontiellaceae bacterium]